jgi:hypothetical protein
LSSQLTQDAIDDLVVAVGPGSGSELIGVEIRHIGGAMARPGAAHGALATMPGEYTMFASAAAPDGAAEQTVRAQFDADPHA